MMNPSDALSPSDSPFDSAASSAQTPDVSSEPTSFSRSSEFALTPELTPVEDVALDEMPGQDFSDDERTRISLLAETVGVQKAWRGAGFVTISRRTVEEHVQIPVTLRHEEITMTRFFRDPDAPESTPDGAPDGVAFSSEFGSQYGEGTVVMRLHEEVAEVIKVVRVAEEVEFARRIVSEETRVIGSARREELDIKAPQNVAVSTSETVTESPTS